MVALKKHRLFHSPSSVTHHKSLPSERILHHPCWLPALPLMVLCAYGMLAHQNRHYLRSNEKHKVRVAKMPTSPDLEVPTKYCLWTGTVISSSAVVKTRRYRHIKRGFKRPKTGRWIPCLCPRTSYGKRFKAYQRSAFFYFRFLSLPTCLHSLCLFAFSPSSKFPATVMDRQVSAQPSSRFSPRMAASAAIKEEMDTYFRAVWIGSDQVLVNGNLMSPIERGSWPWSFSFYLEGYLEPPCSLTANHFHTWSIPKDARPLMTACWEAGREFPFARNTYRTDTKSVANSYRAQAGGVSRNTSSIGRKPYKVRERGHVGFLAHVL